MTTRSLLVSTSLFSLLGFGCANSGPQNRDFGDPVNGGAGTSDINLTTGTGMPSGGTGGTLGIVAMQGMGDGSSDCGSRRHLQEYQSDAAKYSSHCAASRSDESEFTCMGSGSRWYTGTHGG